MPAKKPSAGILLYKLDGTRLKVLLVHPGGPFWERKDEGAWSIPKGEYEDDEDPLAAALREFTEETGATLALADPPTSASASAPTPSTSGSTPAPASAAPHNPARRAPTPLGSVRLTSGKTVTAWAVEADFNPADLVSNTFTMAWPKGTPPREFPEVDRAAWFTPAEARRKVNAAQAAFVDRLIAALRERGTAVDDEAPVADGP